MDGLFLTTVTRQLNALCPCKINKIQNISDEELLVNLHTKQKNQKLVINVRSNTNRIYLANQVETTQNMPTNFVMVLRKQLHQGTITSISQVGYDRLLKMEISTRNEFGDATTFSLMIELMGKYANIVLVNEEGIIVDALKRIPVYENSKRTIHPGAAYTLPTQPEKQDPFQVETIDMDSSLVNQVYGFSPLLSEEFLYRMHHGEEFPDILQECVNSDTLYVYEKEYHCLPLTHLHQEATTYPLMEGLQALNKENENKNRIKEQCGDVFRTVEKELKKAKKKLPKLEKSLQDADQMETYKEYGDLLFAYMGQIQKEKNVTLTRFEDGSEVTIPIDMRYDIKDNANRYYQKYHKLKRSKDILAEQIEHCQEDIDYFETLWQQLQMAGIEDAQEIRQELINQKILQPKKVRAQNKRKKMPNLIHLNVNGVDIYLGKNNIQNHYITSKLSRKSDIWFHVKDYHGSHVLCKDPQPDEELIRLCAMLAAYYSKGGQSSSVPVNYCPVSQLKKVPGSKMGFVTMKSYKTIYIDPDPALIEQWLQEYQIKK